MRKGKRSKRGTPPFFFFSSFRGTGKTRPRSAPTLDPDFMKLKRDALAKHPQPMPILFVGVLVGANGTATRRRRGQNKYPLLHYNLEGSYSWLDFFCTRIFCARPVCGVAPSLSSHTRSSARPKSNFMEVGPRTVFLSLTRAAIG